MQLFPEPLNPQRLEGLWRVGEIGRLQTLMAYVSASLVVEVRGGVFDVVFFVFA